MKIYGEALERDVKKIKKEDEFKKYSEWDSLAYLSVVSLIDDEYGVVITADDFQKFVSISDVEQFLHNQLV